VHFISKDSITNVNLERILFCGNYNAAIESQKSITFLTQWKVNFVQEL